MPCPKCDDEPFLDDYDREFVLTRYHVDVGEPADFEVESKLETLLRIDGDIYKVKPLTDVDPDEVRESISSLTQNSDFGDIVDTLPDNLPQAYDEDAYLSRHLPEENRSDLEDIARENNLTPRAALLLGFVESKNQILGKADDTLAQYIEVRDDLTDNLDHEGGVTPRIQREFVAHLLLATALIEELTSETVFREIYREEHRLGANKSRIDNLPQSQRLTILRDNGIISKPLCDKVQNIKQLRDSLVHDARRRTAMQGQHDEVWLDNKLEDIDEVVAGILNLSGKTAARVIAENGSSEYVVTKCDDALRETIQHWEESDKHHPIQLLKECELVSLADLRWEISIGSIGHRHITGGVNLDELPTDESEATEKEIRLYTTLMEFLQSSEDFLIRRIERDMEQANLDRQDFAVLCLLCAEENSYEDVAEMLGTTVGYVQRKENVLAWRSSEFEKNELGNLPKPDTPIDPFTPDEDSG